MDGVKWRALYVLSRAYSAMDRDADRATRLLDEAAELLGRVYADGEKEPEVLWPLYGLLAGAGRFPQAIALLKDYLQSTEGRRGVPPDERFLAGHHVVDCYAMMRSHEEAVGHHLEYLSGLGASVHPWRRLWSLSDATMASSWFESGRFERWLSLSEEARRGLPEGNADDAEVRRAVAYHLHTEALLRQRQGLHEEAAGCAERILRPYEGDESPDALRLKGDALRALIKSFSERDDERLKEVVGDADLARRPAAPWLLAHGRQDQGTPTLAPLTGGWRTR